MALSDFYDELYREHPYRWGSSGRDEFLCKNMSQPGSVLDIGCGNGHTLEYLSKMWEGTKLYGLDISEVALDIAKVRVPTAEFFCGTVDDIELKVDLALLLGVAEHFEDLKELGRVKKFGGLVYLEVPNCLAYSSSTQEGFRGERIQKEWHLSRYTWEKIIQEQGYKIVKSLIGEGVTWEFIWILENDG